MRPTRRAAAPSSPEPAPPATPSAVEPKYLSHAVTRRDGRVLTGLIAAETSNQVTVIDATGAEAQPAPQDAAPGAAHSFRLAAALGFLSQLAGAFTLLVNGRRALDFNVVLEDTTWTSDDGKIARTFVCPDE